MLVENTTLASTCVIVGGIVILFGVILVLIFGKRKKHEWIGWVVFVVGILCLFSGALFSPVKSEKPKESKVDKTAITDVSFDEIYYAYEKNELRADDTYKDNRYRVTAEINNISTGGLLNWDGDIDLAMVKLVDHTYVFFHATFNKEQKESLKAVNVGDTITFDGTCISSGNWDDCVLVTK